MAHETYSDLESAKAAAAEATAKFGKERIAYRIPAQTLDVAEVYVVAQSMQRARSHAVAVTGLKVEIAERGERKPPRKKTVEETIRALSPEELARARAMLDELSAGGVITPEQNAETAAQAEEVSEKPRGGRRHRG